MITPLPILPPTNGLFVPPITPSPNNIPKTIPARPSKPKTASSGIEQHPLSLSSYCLDFELFLYV